MKFITSQLAYLTSDREARANLGALFKYFAFLVALVSVYAFLFHVIKLSVENEPHSWVTGFYWTLVVMTTLGFGDITFTSDIGRRVQHRRPVVGRRVPAGDAALSVHPAVLCAVARSPGPAAGAARSSRDA